VPRADVRSDSTLTGSPNWRKRTLPDERVARRGAPDVRASKWSTPHAIQPSAVRQVLDLVRFELAREMLCDTSLHIAEIAARLGYRMPSTFARAFRRWSGSSRGSPPRRLLSRRAAARAGCRRQRRRPWSCAGGTTRRGRQRSRRSLSCESYDDFAIRGPRPAPRCRHHEGLLV
jgi:AraC-like DNA-binding protein